MRLSLTDRRSRRQRQTEKVKYKWRQTGAAAAEEGYKGKTNRG